MKYQEKKEEYFKWMLDEYIGNVYIADMATYELLYLNESARETLGQPLINLLGHKCYDVIQGRTSPCPFCTNDCLTEDSFYEWEFFNPLLKRTFIIKNRIIYWNGQRARLELSHDNYSTEYKLEKKEREREAIVRTIPGGFARLDARDMRTVLWYGGKFLELIGYTKEQFETELHSQCTYVHPDDLDRAVTYMLSTKETGEDAIVDVRIYTRDKIEKILTVTFSYVSGQDSWDGLESFYTVGLDVTKERQILEEAFQTARIANTAKTNFLSSMSHDIRTPMNAIVGMVSIAQANLNSPEKINDCLQKINTSSWHLLGLINEVLDMSKIESGKVDLVINQVNLLQLIHNITDICHPLIVQKQQQLQIQTEQIQHENVFADGERLQQLLMNLLSNAIKYTPAGGSITLQVNELDSSLSQKAQYEFICIDTGIGIPAEYIPLVFEPFWRAEDPRISKLQGTGLGMAITDNIVHMMNGTIEIQSEPGKGSTFTVSLPLELCPETEACSREADALSAPMNISKENTQSGLSGKQILLAEDNEMNREILTELLSMHEINVDTAENGQLALEAFESSPPGKYDAILMDIQMPIMNGYEAVAAIRSLNREEARTIPIFALTADAFATDVTKVRSVGMNAHIAKPIDIHYLINVLEQWLN